MDDGLGMKPGRSRAELLRNTRPEPLAAARCRDHERAGNVQPRGLHLDLCDCGGREDNTLRGSVVGEGYWHIQASCPGRASKAGDDPDP